MDHDAWATETFGRAELGDVRRTKRLVQLAAEAARRPSGIVSQACQSSASREGAFRFLENDDVDRDAILRAMGSATAAACSAHPSVYVAIDGSAVSIRDASRTKDIGGVGAWRAAGRGVHAMTALAIAPDGTPVGIVGQNLWVRKTRSKHGDAGARGAPSENDHWVDVVDQVNDAFAKYAPDTKPWYQMDRGADCSQVLAYIQRNDLLATVRATHDRALDGSAKHLRETLRKERIIAKRRLVIPERTLKLKKRVNGKKTTKLKTYAQRRTQVAVRAKQVTLRCNVPGEGIVHLTLNAVLVTEDGRRAEDRVEWMLLTTAPIRTKQQILAVVDGYAMRWKIEELHRAWKKGFCGVEQMQLRTRAGIFKWMTILAAIATRATRLTKLARETPDVLARKEFTNIELDALIAVRNPKQRPDLRKLTLAVAVRWVADIGGYSGPWNGPPGATVIGRGLYDVLVVARALENRKKKR